MKTPQQEKRKVPNVKVRAFWTAGWLITATVLLILFWPNIKRALSTTSSSSYPASSSKKIENAGQDRLLGRWVRDDGGYVLEIWKATSDGKLTAAYFNPNPIHVGSATWQMKDDKLMVTVELRDVNYPGSLYTMEFRDAEKRMVGTYYQAVEGTTYEVEFTREN